MRLVVFLLRLAALVVLAVLTTGLFPRLTFAMPDLMLMIVVAAALLRGARSGVMWGLMAGWLVDLVPPGADVMGSTALTYGAIGLACGLLADGVRRSWFLTALVTIGAAVAVQGARWVLALATENPTGGTVGGWGLLATALVGIVIVPMLMHLENAALTRNAP